MQGASRVGLEEKGTHTVTEKTVDHHVSTMSIQVLAAEPSTKSILANLLELYLPIRYRETPKA